MQAETLLSFPAGAAITDFFVTAGAFHLVLTSTNDWGTPQAYQANKAEKENTMRKQMYSEAAEYGV
jgi:hypothetical protein